MSYNYKLIRQNCLKRRLLIKELFKNLEILKSLKSWDYKFSKIKLYQILGFKRQNFLVKKHIYSVFSFSY